MRKYIWKVANEDDIVHTGWFRVDFLNASQLQSGFPFLSDTRRSLLVEATEERISIAQSKIKKLGGSEILVNSKDFFWEFL